MSDPLPYKGPRLQLALGKFPVTRVIRTPSGFEIGLKLNDISVVIGAPPYADIHEGDLLTLYTEVPYGKPS